MKYFSLVVLMFGLVVTSFGQSLTESSTYDLDVRRAALTAQINSNSGNAEFVRVANSIMEQRLQSLYSNKPSEVLVELSPKWTAVH